MNHPNIAAIYGLEEAEGVRALVLEFVEGVTVTLAELMGTALDAAPSGSEARQAVGVGPHGQLRKAGPLPPEEALPIARQIAEALEAAHEHAIIHRDLKPANIKLRPDGIVKVLDFGLAKLTDPAASRAASVAQGFSPGAGLTAAPTLTTPAVTRQGVIMGTAAYMSPEQAKAGPVDKRADIWEPDRIAVLSLDTGEQKQLLEASSPRFAISGHLLVVREAVLGSCVRSRPPGTNR